MFLGSTDTIQIVLRADREKAHFLDSLIQEAIRHGIQVTKITENSWQADGGSIFNKNELEALITNIVKRELKAIGELANLDRNINQLLELPVENNIQNSICQTEIISSDGRRIEESICCDNLMRITEELEKVQKKCCFRPKEYSQIKTLLSNYFDGDIFSIPDKPFYVAHGNTKRLAVALGNIQKRCGIGTLRYEYLHLCRSLFQCYTEFNIDKNDFQKSNLYKYLKNNKWC